LRDLITLLATALIVLLTAALAGPWFIDWTAHRGWVESELARITATRVRVNGEVDLKLLPVPKLSLRDVRVASNRPDGPVLDIARVRFELAATSLLRGELRFIEAELERPQLSLSLREDGRLMSPRLPYFSASGVQIEKLSVHDGSFSFRLADGRDPIVIGGFDFSGEASTLVGPFRGAGSMSLGSVPLRWRFSTSAIENDHLRAKIIIDESPLGPRADLEGFLGFEGDQSGGQLSFEGQSIFSATSRIGGVSVPWRLAGALKATHAGATLEDAELRAGDDERAFVASGALGLDVAPQPKVRAQFSARQLDLDRLFAVPGQSAARRIATIVSDIVADRGFAEQWPFAIEAALTAPTMTLASETLTDTRAQIALSPGEAPRLIFSAQGPARSALSLDGTLETGAAAAYRGKLDFSARDIPRLSTWLALISPEAAGLYDLPFRSLDMAGDVEISGVGAIGRSMRLRLDRSDFSGALAYTRAQGQEPARLFADLGSDALDLEGLPDLSAPTRFAAGLDLSLTLDARALRLERFGTGTVDAGRIGLKLVKNASGTKIERFSIENIGGASIAASGQMSEAGTELTARVDAQRLGDLAALLQRIAPGVFADGLATRAVALSPLRLDVSARGHDLSAPEHLRIEGSARGSRIGLILQPTAGKTEVAGLAENPDAGMLLRQIGVETLPISSLGVGRLNLRATGNADKGFSTALSLSAARVEAVFEGVASGVLSAPDMRGQLRVRSNDGASFLRLVGYGLPDVSLSLPLEGTADMTFAKGDVSLTNLSGVVAGTFVNGALRNVDDEGLRRWSGVLRTDRLSLPLLASFALGPPQAAARGAVWPELKFPPGLADAPRLRLDFSVGEFDLAEGLSARDAVFQLHLEPGLVALESARMKIGEGSLGGNLTIRRDANGAALSLKADATAVALPQSPVIGRLSGHFEITSTGASYSALAAGLAGEGTGQLEKITVAGADASALGRLIAGVDRGQVNVDERDLRASLLRESERAPYQAAQREVVFSAAAGVMRLESFNAPRLSMIFDARQWSAEARFALPSPTHPRDWQGDPPEATLIWQGKWAAMQRTVDAAPLFNAISARAIARGTLRAEALDEDIRERAAIQRRAKAFEFLRRREREILLFGQDERRRADAPRQR